MNLPDFPTPQHRQVAETAGVFFNSRPEVDTILVVNSCARGVATAGSDVDMAVLVGPGVSQPQISLLEAEWDIWRSEQTVLAKFEHSGRFRGLHLDIIDGRYQPDVWDDGGGPDGFELAIGNHIAYSAPLGQLGDYFQQLRTDWLPYYDHALQQSRCAMANQACLYDLEHVSFYAERGLLFQAFDRLYKAHQEFLQMLFIHQKAYPLAYNKWIAQQLKEVLNKPDLANQLRPVLAISQLSPSHLSAAADALLNLIEDSS